jgi:KilA-N domain
MSKLAVVQKDGWNVIEFDYNNSVIDYVLQKEYFNATAMAKACGKEMSRWLETKDAAEDIFLTASDIKGSAILGISEEAFMMLSAVDKVKYVKEKEYFDMVKTRKGGNVQLSGTFVHRELAIMFAQWLNPRFRRQVSAWINQLATHGKVILNPTEAADFEKFKQQQRSKPQLPAKPVDEIDLQFRILDWVNLCVNNARFNIEVPMLNSKNKVRRIDFIKNNGRNVIAYELKLNSITLNDVTEAIANREYFELLSNHYNRPITFIFLSPLGIANNATTLLRTMPNIKFQTVHELCYQYYIKGINNKWKNNVVNLTNNMNTNRFNCLFN